MTEILTAKEANELAKTYQVDRDHKAYENVWASVQRAAEQGGFSVNIQVATKELRDKVIKQAEALGYSTRQTNGLLILSWR